MMTASTHPTFGNICDNWGREKMFITWLFYHPCRSLHKIQDTGTRPETSDDGEWSGQIKLSISPTRSHNMYSPLPQSSGLSDGHEQLIYASSTIHNPTRYLTANKTISAQPPLTPSGRAFARGGNVRNVSRNPLSPCIIYWPDNEPLPEQGQIRPSGPLGIPPPIVNTGNKGSIIHVWFLRLQHIQLSNFLPSNQVIGFA